MIKKCLHALPTKICKQDYRNHLKECPGLNERSLQMSALFTAEKFNEHSGLKLVSLPNQEKGTHLEICNICRGAHSDSL